MRRKSISTFFVLALILVSAGLAVAQIPGNDRPLNNAAILKLARAGFKEKTIIAIIDSRPAAYDLSPDAMIELKKNGVNENVILAMLNRQQGLSAYDDDRWQDDPFFQDKRDKQKGNQPRDQKETEIFGSGGSNQSNTKNRGSGDAQQGGDTQTTGNATVRIIRPPTEAGAPLKLEKTPSLTNDSIIELVEAGFSEGTILRRIDQSPVEFDLSPAKVAELKKHRVGEKIIAAMRTAMGDENPAANGKSKP